MHYQEDHGSMLVSAAYNHDLTSMVDKYAEDNDFALIFQDLMNDNTKEPYSLNEGLLLHGSRLCIVKDLRVRRLCMNLILRPMRAIEGF